MGILYAAILFIPNQNLYLFFAIPVPAWIFGVAYLLYSIYGMKKKLGNIGHDAHIGGAIGGYVLTILFAPYLLDTSLWIVVLLAFPIILLVILHKLGKI
jgi:membrane associated rhomboid family serine protease